MKIAWSPLAREQAESAFDYIAEDRPHAAANWLAGLFQRVELLSRFPDQGREVPEARRAGLREIIYDERHRVVYRIDGDRIRILLVHPCPIPMSTDVLDAAE